jgi:hypothetical protein
MDGLRVGVPGSLWGCRDKQHAPRCYYLDALMLDTTAMDTRYDFVKKSAVMASCNNTRARSDQTSLAATRIDHDDLRLVQSNAFVRHTLPGTTTSALTSQTRFYRGANVTPRYVVLTAAVATVATVPSNVDAFTAMRRRRARVSVVVPYKT